MELGGLVDHSTSPSKYRRVCPIIGLVLLKKEVMILSETLLIVISIGPVTKFYLSLLGVRRFRVSAIGGTIVLISIFFMMLGIISWFKK
jgi:hypothetical protein